VSEIERERETKECAKVSKAQLDER